MDPSTAGNDRMEDTDIDRQIGHRIRLRRTQLNLTRDDLAAAVGVSAQSIAKYESGLGFGLMTIRRLRNLSRALNIPSGTLLGTSSANLNMDTDAALLLAAFYRFPNSSLRKRVSELLSGLVNAIARDTHGQSANHD